MTAPKAQAALAKAMRDGSFAPVYLLHGDDDFRKEAAVRQLVASAVEAGLRDFNVELRRGADLDAETLGALLATPPMMADRRVLVVRDVGALRKDARTELDRYLARPAADAVVVLVAPAGAKPDRPLLDHAAVSAVEFKPLEGDKLPGWIVGHARTELGVEITPEAASLLLAAVGADLPSLATELDKLASYAGERAIDEEAVSAIVGVRRGETLGDFLDAVAARDAARALALLPHVQQQPKASAVTTVMALGAQTLMLAWAQAARAEGMGAGVVAKELWTVLKESGGVFLGRPWGEAVAAWTRYYPGWSAAALDAALDALLAADVALKESRVSSDEQVLATLVLTLCAPDAAHDRSAA